MQVEDLNLIPYEQAWHYQKQLVQAKLQNPQYPDTLLLAEHPPVYTLGKGASLHNLLQPPESLPCQVYRVERGGEVTYHCPGQLVCYPILDLRLYKQDLHWYLRQLEEVVIQLLAQYGVTGRRIPGLTGVWVGDEKIAAIGIKVKRWITMHGFAININCDLSGFDLIIPCGIKDKKVTRLSNYCPSVSLPQVKQQLVPIFLSLFKPQSPLVFS